MNLTRGRRRRKETSRQGGPVEEVLIILGILPLKLQEAPVEFLVTLTKLRVRQREN